MNEEGGTEVRREDVALKLDALSTIGAIEDSRESGNIFESMAPAKSEDRRRNELENACDREYTIKVVVRPFMCKNLLREIVFLRQALVEHRADTRELLKFVDAKG